MPQTNFVSTLKELRAGGALDDLNDTLTDLVATVRATGRPGKLTLTLSVKAGKGNANQLMVDDTIAVKKPVKETETTIFFATDENVLQRNDPRQPELTGLRRPADVRNMTDMKERASNGD